MWKGTKLALQIVRPKMEQDIWSQGEMVENSTVFASFTGPWKSLTKTNTSKLVRTTWLDCQNQHILGKHHLEVDTSGNIWLNRKKYSGIWNLTWKENNGSKYIQMFTDCKFPVCKGTSRLAIFWSCIHSSYSLEYAECRPLKIEDGSMNDCNKSTAAVCHRPLLSEGSIYSGSGFLGCTRMVDDPLPIPDFTSDHNTIQQCVEICRGLEKKIALLHNKDCYCKDDREKLITIPSTFCLNDKPCPGNPFQICGGNISNYLTAYDVGPKTLFTENNPGNYYYLCQSKAFSRNLMYFWRWCSWYSAKHNLINGGIEEISSQMQWRSLHSWIPSLSWQAVWLHWFWSKAHFRWIKGHPFECK